MFDEASRALHKAREELLAAETAATTARRAKDDAGRNLATLTERAASMLRRHEASLQELAAAARHQVNDDDLEQRLSSAALLTESAESELTAAQAAVDAAEPEAIALELQRAEGAERSIRVDIEKLNREKRDLEIELKALGHDGLGEACPAEVEITFQNRERGSPLDTEKPRRRAFCTTRFHRRSAKRRIAGSGQCANVLSPIFVSFSRTPTSFSTKRRWKSSISCARV